MKTALKLASWALVALVIGFATPARAMVIAYNYDAAGRLTGANYGGVSNTTYAYDKNGNLLARTNTVSQFVPLAGNYAGLIAATPVSVAGAGIVTLKVSLTGNFTGKLTLGGKSFSIAGLFNEITGDSAAITLKGTTIVLNLHIDAVTREITGNFTGGVVAALSALPAPFLKTNPAPGGVVGTFTALFHPTENLTTRPKGGGFGTVKIAATGSVKLAATLADGTKISQGTMLVSDSQWPLYVPLYKGGGFVGGLITFAPTPGAGDFFGTIDWIKPATTKGLYLPGFTTQVELDAARYTPPLKGQQIIEVFDLEFAANFNTVRVDCTLDAKNVVGVIPPNAAEVKLKINAKSGTLTGSLIFGGKVRKLSALFQLEDQAARGFFFSDTESLNIFFGND